MNIFKRGQKSQPQSPQQPQQPTTGGAQPQQQASQPGAQQGPNLQHVQAGSISLISYSPEEALAQVEEARSKISFGMSGIKRFMARYTDVWSLIGPLLYR